MTQATAVIDPSVNAATVIGGGGGLFMDMGTGKSLVTVGLIISFGFMRTLVVAPKKVITTDVWGKEFAKHAPGKVKVVPLVPIGRTRSGKLRQGSSVQAAQLLRDEIIAQKIDGLPRVFVIGYQMVWRDELVNALHEVQWDLCVLDESHRIKAPGGRCSMFLGHFGKRVPYRLCLTGTPQPHNPLDIYSQYRFLDQGIFGTSFKKFKQHYAVLNEWGGVETYQNEPELAERMYSIAYRVTKEVLNLPPARHVTYNYELGDEAWRYYGALDAELTTSIVSGTVMGSSSGSEYVIDEEGELSETVVTDDDGNALGTVTAKNTLVRMIRLAQLCSGYLPMDSRGDLDPEATRLFRELGLPVPEQQPRVLVEIDHAKEELLEETIEDLPADYTVNPPVFEPLVVFCRFVPELDIIKRTCERLGRRCAELSGRRDETSLWQDGEYDTIVVQIQAGSEGIDLTRAHFAIIYTPDFSLGRYDQMLARLDRPGQTESVLFIHLVGKDTIEEATYEALEKRRGPIQYIEQLARERYAAQRQRRSA